MNCLISPMTWPAPCCPHSKTAIRPAGRPISSSSDSTASARLCARRLPSKWRHSLFRTGHNRDTVRAGLKRLDQIRNINFSGTGQTDGLDGVALRTMAKAGKLVGRQVVGAIKNVRFQSSLVHKRILGLAKKTIKQADPAGVTTGPRCRHRPTGTCCTSS